jgi:hypothetical protein
MIFSSFGHPTTEVGGGGTTSAPVSGYLSTVYMVIRNFIHLIL